MSEKLPPEFSDLDIFLPWALATERERSECRQASAMSAINAFYAAMLPRMEAVLTCLAKHPNDDTMPNDIRLLFYLALALAEVAPAVENYGQPSVIDGYDVARMIAVHE